MKLINSFTIKLIDSWHQEINYNHPLYFIRFCQESQVILQLK
jgi:hypothetical protein